MERTACDVAIVGGGIVGMATAHALGGRAKIVVLEAEDRLAAHQTGRNSGVIHAGLYYKPGSLKARLCVEGREAMFRFCEQHAIPHARCGKLVVAADDSELPGLAALEERARAHGLAVRRLDAAAIKDVEPRASGVAALHVPETGVTDFAKVLDAMAAECRLMGVDIRLGARVVAAAPGHLETTLGPVSARVVVTCAGLQSDRVARLCGATPGVRIVPFRGEYWTLCDPSPVRALIYPVPDPRFPFLGVHFTRRISGVVEAGPNALLSLHRDAARMFSFRDAAATLSWPGFWRFAARHAGTGIGEMRRSMSRRALARALARLVPGVTAAHLVPAGSGVRAQAMDSKGRLLDDFHIVEEEKFIHVLNAPSPAATASLAIGKHIAESVMQRLQA